MAYWIIILMTFLGAYASVCLKKAISQPQGKNILLSFHFYLGGGLYFFAALLNIYVLTLLDYTVVLPLTSITYIWTMVLSYYIFKDNIGLKKMLGVLLIIIGAFFVAL